MHFNLIFIPCFLESKFLRVQVFQGPGLSEEFMAMWRAEQTCDVMFPLYPDKNKKKCKFEKNVR